MRIQTAPALPPPNAFTPFTAGMLGNNGGGYRGLLRCCLASSTHPLALMNTILGRGQHIAAPDIDEEAPIVARWDGARGDWFNYTLFPTIIRVPVEALSSGNATVSLEVHYVMCMYSNVQPTSLSVTSERRWLWQEYKTAWGSTVHVDLAVLQCGREGSKYTDVHTGLALMTALDLMNPKDGSYLWFADVTESPQLQMSGIRGPSLGLAVAAAIAGCPPFVYTGYIKRAGYSAVGSYHEEGRTRRTLFDVAKPDDIIESVQDLDIKIASAMASSRVLIIPHVSSLNTPLVKVIEGYVSNASADPISGVGYADRYRPAQFRKQYQSRSLLFRQSVRMYSTSDCDGALSFSEHFDAMKTILLATSMPEVGQLSTIAWNAFMSGYVVMPYTIPNEDSSAIGARVGKTDAGRIKRYQSIVAYKAMTPIQRADAMDASAQKLEQRAAEVDRKVRAAFEAKRRVTAERTAGRVTKKRTRAVTVRAIDPNRPPPRPMSALQKARLAASRGRRGLTGRAKEKMLPLTRHTTAPAPAPPPPPPPLTAATGALMSTLPPVPVDDMEEGAGTPTNPRGAATRGREGDTDVPAGQRRRLGQGTHSMPEELAEID